MARRPHILAIAFPGQGHVRPLMKLSHWIAYNGIKVTFVVTDSIHAKVLAAMPKKGDDNEEQKNSIKIVSIPDEIDEQGDDEQKYGTNKIDSMFKVMASHLEDLMRKMMNSTDDDEQITCVLAESMVGWALEIAEKMGIKGAMFWSTTVPALSLVLQIPALMENGITDEFGVSKENEMVQLSPHIPAMSTADFTWNCSFNPVWQNMLFKLLLPTSRTVKISNWLLCNSFYELDPLACDLIPNLLPVGPLPSSTSLGQPAGNFWPEDSTCLNWLDQQPTRSVIYIAFGSIAMFSRNQLYELALGLELVGQPFLWVVRKDFIQESIVNYPDGFIERIAKFGKIVEWAPQDKVLAHPSIGLFLTHCGWNSTMEGLSYGVPFLCWPYFADQFHVRSYICDVWKVGLGLISEESGIVSKHEIKGKMEKLLADDDIRTNALKLKEMARKSVSEGGSSSINFKTFVELLKC